ncbi:MAG: ShlB/FhaC/HecB family hemolysin secretion/activation protein [Steroidobacter sp.]
MRVGYGTLGLVWLSALFPGMTHAQTPQDIDKAAQQNQRILQQQQERERQQREEEEARRRTPSGQELTAPQIKPSSAGAQCSNIHSIALQGATLLSDAELKSLIAPYIDKCLTLADINQLIAAVTNAYVQHGYVTARVYIPAQDTSSAQLQLLVVEGRLTGVSVQPVKSISIATAFPGVVGKVLNLRDIEQGLDQVNRLRSNSATIDIVPGDGPGASQVVIHNQLDKRWQISLGVDNSGTHATGLNQYSASLGYDNALGLNDYINASVRRSEAEYGNEHSQSGSLYASVPYGYWTFSTALSDFDYTSIVNGQVRSFETSGNSKSYGVSADRLLYRDRQTKWLVTGGFTFKDVRNDIEGEQIDSSSHKLSVVNVETSVTRFISGALLSAELGIDRGVRALGSQHDEAGLPDDAPHAQYTIYKYGLSVQRTFQSEPTDIHWQSELRGQYSNDTLYGTEQLTIGNLFNVRGFREYTVSSNRGVYLRNTLGFPFHAGGDASIEPYIGYDTGHVAGQDTVAGWTAGCRVSMRNGSLQLEYAQPETALPSSSSSKESGWLYASATVSF